MLDGLQDHFESLWVWFLMSLTSHRPNQQGEKRGKSFPLLSSLLSFLPTTSRHRSPSFGVLKGLYVYRCVCVGGVVREDNVILFYFPFLFLLIRNTWWSRVVQFANEAGWCRGQRANEETGKRNRKGSVACQQRRGWCRSRGRETRKQEED